MTRGQGGGPKRKYKTPEDKEEARRASKRAYDNSERRKTQRHKAKAAHTKKTIDSKSLKDFLTTAWPPKHPLSLSTRCPRLIPHRFEVPNPEWRANVTLPRLYRYSEHMELAWQMVERNPSVNRWYRDWIGMALFEFSTEEIEERPWRSGDYIDGHGLTSAFAGWWIRVITTSFIEAYDEVSQPSTEPARLIDGSKTDVAAQDAIWRSGTIKMTATLNEMWTQLEVGYRWVESYCNEPFEEAFHAETRDKILIAAREYLWWRYHHIALLHQELRRRLKLDCHILLREVKLGKAPWQTSWRVLGDAMWRNIRDLWRHRSSSDSSSLSDSDSDDYDSGDEADYSGSSNEYDM